MTHPTQPNHQPPPSPATGPWPAPAPTPPPHPWGRSPWPANTPPPPFPPGSTPQPANAAPPLFWPGSGPWPAYSPPPPFPPGGGPWPVNTPPNQPKRSARGLWITLGIVALALAVLIPVLHLTEGSNDRQITRAITEFGHAIDSNDQPTAVSFLCAAEADQITDGKGYDGDGATTVAPDNPLPINVSNIRVVGDEATAQLTRPPQPPRTLHLKKESGKWKLCNPENH